MFWQFGPIRYQFFRSFIWQFLNRFGNYNYRYFWRFGHYFHSFLSILGYFDSVGPLWQFQEFWRLRTFWQFWKKFWTFSVLNISDAFRSFWRVLTVYLAFWQFSSFLDVWQFCTALLVSFQQAEYVEWRVFHETTTFLRARHVTGAHGYHSSHTQ